MPGFEYSPSPRHPGKDRCLIPITFQKEAAVELLRTISEGQPLAPPSGRWSVNDMLLVAGVLHFAVMSNGPMACSEDDFGSKHPEGKDAAIEQNLAELQAA